MKSPSNICFIKYANFTYDGAAPPVANTTAYLAALGVAGGACTAIAQTGKAELGEDGVDISVKLACQGIVLMNNFLDIFQGVIDDVGGDDLSSAFPDALTTILNAARTTVTDSYDGAEDIVEVISQEKCETDNASDDKYLTGYFQIVFEAMIQ